MVNAIISDHSIRKRLQGVSRNIGLPLKYRVLKVSGEKWYTVDYAKGSTRGRLCRSCKTQSVCPISLPYFHNSTG